MVEAAHFHTGVPVKPRKHGKKKAYLTLLAAAGSGIVAVSAQVGETGRSKTKGHLDPPT